MFSLSDTRFFKLTTHLKRTAHFFQTEGQVALIQRIDGYEPAQYPLLRCKGTAFYAIHQAFYAIIFKNFLVLSILHPMGLRLPTFRTFACRYILW